MKPADSNLTDTKNVSTNWSMTDIFNTWLHIGESWHPEAPCPYVLLDYAHIMQDKPSNDSFSHKIENVQYRACLVITGAI